MTHFFMSFFKFGGGYPFLFMESGIEGIFGIEAALKSGLKDTDVLLFHE